MKTTIIYKSNKSNEGGFRDINVGEFFIQGQDLYIKVNSGTAFNLREKKCYDWNSWDDIIEPKVTITVET